MTLVQDNARPPLEVDTQTLVDVLGLSEARVGQLAREKIVVKLARGRFDLAASVKNYLGFLRRGAKGSGDDLPALRAELLREQIERAKRQNEQAKNILLPADVVFGYLGRLAARWDQLLTQKLDVEMPARLQGKDIVAARAEAIAVHDEIREICNAGIVGASKELTDSGTAALLADDTAP